MSKGFWVAQEGHYVPVILPVSAGAAQAGKRFNMANFAHASVILMLGAAGGPIGAITLNVYAAETGGAGVAIPYRIFKQEAAGTPYDVLSAYSTMTAAGYTPASDLANAAYVIEFDAQEILAANNGTYVEVDIAVGSMGTTPQLLAALAILSGGRNMSDQQASAQI
jgi:hypothetical protein